MMLDKLRCALAAQVFLQRFAVAIAQIDDDQPVQCVRKASIDVECEHFAAHFQVLFEQNWDPFAVKFEFRNGTRKLFRVANEPVKGANIPMFEPCRAEWTPWLHHCGQRMRRKLRLKELIHQRSRRWSVRIADANRTKQHRMLRIQGNMAPDSLP